MFLSNLIKQNSAFAAAVIDLHQAGHLPPDCYVIDLDTMAVNGRLICDEAHRHGIEVIAMTKQFGRHPAALETLRSSGVDSFVAVDMTCARAICRADQPLGHIGHLVQVPTRQADEAFAMRPHNWTVVSMAKAERGRRRGRSGRHSNKPCSLESSVHRTSSSRVTQVGSMPPTCSRRRNASTALDGGAFVGVTSYPALTFDRDEHVVVPTPNLGTLERARTDLEAAGWTDVRVNAPGETSTKVISLLASAGATQIEPGHGFTATGAYHAFADLPERPAMIYLSEVSHTDGDTRSASAVASTCASDRSTTRRPRSSVQRSTKQSPTVSTRRISQQHQEIDFYGRLAAPIRTT